MAWARGARGAGLTLLVCLLVGCAAHQPPASSTRFIKHGPPSDGLEASFDVPGATAPVPSVPAVPVVPAVPAVRVAPVVPALPTIEEQDPALTSALSTLSAAPSAGAYRAVGTHYLRLQVFDRAYDEFTHAIALAPRDARGFEGRARTWRDWGLPDIALGDAYRAVAFAPGSAVAQNTLGTVLYAVGDRLDAKLRFALARDLDPRAAYPWSNLCYLAFLDGDMAEAGALCTTALSLEPTLGSARHNLALVHAAQGRMNVAEALFGLDPSAPRAGYNLGIVRSARGEFDAAAHAFAVACRGFTIATDACARAKQAREQADAIRPAPGGGPR